MLPKYYQEKKGRLLKKVHGGYQGLSKEEKEKKQQWSCKQYKNLSKNEKNMLVEYRKKW